MRNAFAKIKSKDTRQNFELNLPLRKKAVKSKYADNYAADEVENDKLWFEQRRLTNKNNKTLCLAVIKSTLKTLLLCM